VNAVGFALDDVLVTLDGDAPVPWHGSVMPAAEAGLLCAEQVAALTVWAPDGTWLRATSLLAMCRSADSEACLVVTDTLPPLDLVPADVRIAAVEGHELGPVELGRASYACAELRSDRVFRLVLSGRARRRPKLEPLLALHTVSRTARGRRVIERWKAQTATLFGMGQDGTMPEELRADLSELATAAQHAEHAIVGGFHALDRVVRGAAEWEAGAARYLRLAASMSPGALTSVDRWLDSVAGWHEASPAGALHRRLTAARLLHRLVDDPWLPGYALADLMGGGPTL
jgi:hypothetical protein